MQSHRMRRQLVVSLISLFFSDKRYDLGEVGRYRINKKLDASYRMDNACLPKKISFDIIKYYDSSITTAEILDDIDHLQNRRVRTVGEQLYAQFGVGLGSYGSYDS